MKNEDNPEGLSGQPCVFVLFRKCDKKVQIHCDQQGLSFPTLSTSVMTTDRVGMLSDLGDNEASATVA